jgi:hypothetical protein
VNNPMMEDDNKDFRRKTCEEKMVDEQVMVRL